MTNLGGTTTLRNYFKISCKRRGKVKKDQLKMMSFQNGKKTMKNMEMKTQQNIGLQEDKIDKIA